MALPQRKLKYTYSDYCLWDDGKRWELIDGVPYEMSPAPTRKHQEISGALLNQLYNFLKNKPCEVYAAPFDVRLNADEDDDIVVQPDIVVVCDRSKLDDKGCKGAPDLVIEILSPASMRMDSIIKPEKYRQAGVREYWMVDPKTCSVWALVMNGCFCLTNYCYAKDVFSDEEKSPEKLHFTLYYTAEAPVSVLPGCVIDLKEVFLETE